MRQANGGDGEQDRSEPELTPANCNSCPARAAAFCANVSGGSLTRLDRMVHRVRRAKGQFVAEEGEPCPGLITVISGTVRLFKSLSDGRRQITGFRYGGELVMAPCRDLPSPISVQAIEPSVFCLLEQKMMTAMGISVICQLRTMK